MELIFLLSKTILIKPLLVSFLITFLATYLSIPLLSKWGLVDDPNKRKHPAHTHIGIIPRAGGIAIFLGILLSSILLLTVNKQLGGVLTGGLIIVIIGVLDDKYDLSPYLRFGLNILAAMLVVGAGIGVSYITNPLGGIIRLDQWVINLHFYGIHKIVVLADLFAILWIVWCMNMVNWSKGVDGQMPGFVAIAAMIIGILSFRFVNGGALEQWVATSLSFIVAGAYLGFLPWNFYPQKIMPGYSGGALAGFMLAVLSILSTAKVGTAVLVLGMPMMDAVYTILRRIVKKKSPFWGDRGHLHHRLMNIGWSKRKIALFYYLVSAILGLIALTVTSKVKVFTILFVAVILGGILLWLSFFSTFSKPLDRDNG